MNNRGADLRAEFLEELGKRGIPVKKGVAKINGRKVGPIYNINGLDYYVIYSNETWDRVQTLHWFGIPKERMKHFSNLPCLVEDPKGGDMPIVLLCGDGQQIKKILVISSFHLFAAHYRIGFKTEYQFTFHVVPELYKIKVLKDANYEKVKSINNLCKPVKLDYFKRATYETSGRSLEVSRQIGAKVSAQLYERIKEHTDSNGISISDFIRDAVEWRLSENQQSPNEDGPTFDTLFEQLKIR